MTTTIFIYCFINIFAWIGMVMLCLGLGETWSDYLIYPKMWNALDDKDINTVGKILALTLYTLSFFPAVVSAYATLIVWKSASWIGKLCCKIFKKRG